MKSKLLTIYFFLVIVNSFMFSYSYYFDFQFDVDLAIFISFISILTIVYHILFEKNLFSIINIFNGFSILFLYGNVINYILFDIETFYIYNLLEGANIPPKYFIASLFLINVGLSIINLTYITFKKSNNETLIPTNKIPKDIMFIFIIFSIFASVKFYLELKHISSIGYVNFYLNGVGDLNYYSPIIKYSHTFLLVIFSVILSYIPKKKVYIIVSVIYCSLMMLNSLKGARVLFLLPLLFSLWFYFKYYSRITLSGNIFRITTIFLILIIGFSTLKSSRLNEESSILNISDLPSLILAETGSTQQLVALYLYRKDDIKSNYPFVLEPILYPFYYYYYYDIYKAGQSESLVETRNSLNHKFSYLINPSYYLKGNAVGSSMMAESFQYGLIYFYLIMIIFSSFLIFMENFRYDSKYIVFLPILFNTAVFASRDSPFPNTWGLLKLAVLLILIYLIRYILKYKSNSNFAKKVN